MRVLRALATELERPLLAARRRGHRAAADRPPNANSWIRCSSSSGISACGLLGRERDLRDRRQRDRRQRHEPARQVGTTVGTAVGTASTTSLTTSTGVLVIDGIRFAGVALAVLVDRQPLGQLVEAAGQPVRVRPVGRQPPRIDREVLRVQRVARAQVVQLRCPGPWPAWPPTVLAKNERQLALVEPDEVDRRRQLRGRRDRAGRAAAACPRASARRPGSPSRTRRSAAAAARAGSSGRARCPRGPAASATARAPPGRSWVISGSVSSANSVRRSNVMRDSSSNVGSARNAACSSLVARRGRREHRVGVLDQRAQLAVALGQRLEDDPGVGDQARDRALLAVEDVDDRRRVLGERRRGCRARR